MASHTQEPALKWLDRVKTSSKSIKARRMAHFAINEWQRLKQSWKDRDVKTNRSLWDLLAGVFECHQNITHHTYMTEVISGDNKFYFPIFVEACGRRAKNPSASNAIIAGVSVKSERLPQTGKWHNYVCKT
jgi:hypothetical protein